ncbi:MAG: HIT family protein [Erysipelotrichaceae bacterium]|nr:HIT family protein [Erysipelotrichaceae bacterium]MBR2552285.1 HIT family protein [Erysipelotrichaceae bacterium]MDO5439200.1 HIT family protein [Erysipelotrichaceae bacterium]
MCVFCEIIKGNIPSAKVYEDDKTLAILDISQTTKGHTLVLPKQHYANLLEIPAEELSELIVKVQKIAANNVEKLGAKGFNLLVNTGAVAGQSVPHLHFHIIPRYDENDSIEISFTENKFDLTEISALLK